MVKQLYVRLGKLIFFVSYIILSGVCRDVLCFLDPGYTVRCSFGVRQWGYCQNVLFCFVLLFVVCSRIFWFYIWCNDQLLMMCLVMTTPHCNFCRRQDVSILWPDSLLSHLEARDNIYFKRSAQRNNFWLSFQWFRICNIKCRTNIYL